MLLVEAKKQPPLIIFQEWFQTFSEDLSLKMALIGS